MKDEMQTTNGRLVGRPSVLFIDNAIQVHIFRDGGIEIETGGDWTKHLTPHPSHHYPSHHTSNPSHHTCLDPTAVCTNCSVASVINSTPNWRMHHFSLHNQRQCVFLMNVSLKTLLLWPPPSSPSQTFECLHLFNAHTHSHRAETYWFSWTTTIPCL